MISTVQQTKNDYSIMVTTLHIALFLEEHILICCSVQLDLGLDSWYLDLGFKTKGKSFEKHFNVYLSLDMLTIILYYEGG